LPGAPERCLNAWDDNCNGLADEGCGLHTGLAQFLIAWDAPGADVDLDVLDPGGQLAEAGQVTSSGLLKERDCPGRNDDCKGARIENVYLEAGRKLVNGSFTVRVRLATLRDKDAPVRVALAVRLGDRNYAQRFALMREGEERQFRFAP
jgi:tRNA (guanosine-2'-O-)-methyltransferase